MPWMTLQDLIERTWRLEADWASDGDDVSLAGVRNVETGRRATAEAKADESGTAESLQNLLAAGRDGHEVSTRLGLACLPLFVAVARWHTRTG